VHRLGLQRRGVSFGACIAGCGCERLCALCAPAPNLVTGVDTPAELPDLLFILQTMLARMNIVSAWVVGATWRVAGASRSCPAVTGPMQAA
jgi:hypothetical protein